MYNRLLTVILFALAAFLGFVQCNKGSEPSLPAIKSAFTPSTKTGNAPLTVQFTNQSEGASGYTWHFGTGDTTNTASPAYTYTAPGTYTVRLVARSSDGRSATATETIVVNALPCITPYCPANLPGTWVQVTPGSQCVYYTSFTINAAGVFIAPNGQLNFSFSNLNTGEIQTNLILQEACSRVQFTGIMSPTRDSITGKWVKQAVGPPCTDCLNADRITYKKQ